MERLSALMDGELDGHEVDHELARIKMDPEQEATWAVYHLIGDAMRGEDVSARSVMVQVRTRLASEPTVLAPRLWKARQAVWRVALPLAASVCAVAVVAWLVLPGYDAGVPANLAAPGAILAESREYTRDLSRSEGDVMSEYLMAHQQFSPSTTMQGVVPYVRTVSAVDGAR